MENSKKIGSILYIIDTLNSAGAERSLMQIALHLKKFTPIFVHIYPGEILKSELENNGIKVYSLNLNQKYGFRLAGKKIEKIIRNEKPVIIHSTLYRSDIVARRLKSYFPEIPLIGSFVNNSYTSLRYYNQNFIMRIKLWFAYKIDRKLANKVDFFISNSETIKKSEGGALGIPSSKIEVIYRGRNLAQFDDHDESVLASIKTSLGLDGKNVLINVSRLIQRKAQLDIINAMPAVLKEFPETILLIAGHGEYKSILEKRVLQLNLGDHVKLLERRMDVPELLEISKIFVYPSYAEGLPGALIEAMMAGKLIIASNIGENLECINSDSALIFNKGNVDQLAQKIIYGLANFSELKKLGEIAKSQAQEKFEIQKIVSKYETLYTKVLKNNEV